MENEKYIPRVYSLNLIAYLINTGCVIKGKFRDSVNDKAYFVFEENEKTLREIKNYKEDDKLHEFLNIFRELKVDIKKI